MEHKPSRWKQFLFSNREPQFNPYVVPRVDPSEEAVALRRQKWAEFQLLEPHLFTRQSQRYLNGIDAWPEKLSNKRLLQVFQVLVPSLLLVLAALGWFGISWLVGYFFIVLIFAVPTILYDEYSQTRSLAENGKITLGEVCDVIKLVTSTLFNQTQKFKISYSFQLPNGNRVTAETTIYTTSEITPGDDVVILFVDEKSFLLL